MKNNLIISKIEKLRAQILELEEERFWLEDSLLPANELHDRICGIIDDMAGNFNTNWNGFDHTSLTVNGRILEGLNATASDLGPILATLLGPEIKANLKQKIDSSNYEAGPPQKDRPGLLTDIDKRLATLESVEEGLIVEAAKIGQHIDRRDDMSAEIILEYIDD